jgi:predicted nucleotidyltransferase
MKNDVSPKAILQQVQFHDRLNPRLWRDIRLRPEVRLKLVEAAIAFYKFLDIDRLIVKDIILTGSNAAYNYTDLSDIDIHLLVDFVHSTCPDLASNFFDTKKALWSKTYDVTVRTHAIELYVEDVDDPVAANGVYSILHSHWIRIPSRTPPRISDEAIVSKTEELASEIDAVLRRPSMSRINLMLAKLYDLRQHGLSNGGEFSTENSAFKALRALGYIEKLHDRRTRIRDSQLSL